MLARTDDVATIAERWLAQFEAALAAPGPARLATLFHADSHWRDVLALTWQIKTVDGSDAIAPELATQAGRVRPTGFRIGCYPGFRIASSASSVVGWISKILSSRLTAKVARI